MIINLGDTDTNLASSIADALMELIAPPEAQDIMLGGGFGMIVKRAHLKALQGNSIRLLTLMEDLPELRVTQDIDLLLTLDLWLNPPTGKAFYDKLERLGYQKHVPNWKFKKSGSLPDSHVVIDLLARQPTADEDVRIKTRYGIAQVGKGMHTGVAGRLTPEAFAIHELPISIDVSYRGLSGTVLVPHPFSWIHLKVRAAYDWLLETRGEKLTKLNVVGNASVRLKHVYDVFALIAMITEEEQDEAALLAAKYSGHPEAEASKLQIVELYGSATAPGFLAVKRYAQGRGAEISDSDFDLFWDTLITVLGVS